MTFSTSRHELVKFFILRKDTFWTVIAYISSSVSFSFFFLNQKMLNEPYVLLLWCLSSCSVYFVSYDTPRHRKYCLHCEFSKCQLLLKRCNFIVLLLSGKKLVLYRIVHGYTFNLFGFAHVRLIRAFRSCSTLLGLSVKVVFFNWSTLGL